jgi:hypothetical protein
MSSVNHEHVQIESEIIFHEEYESIKFSHCTFIHNVIFDKCKITGRVEFIECIFLNRARLLFLSGIFEDRILLSFRSLRELLITGGNFKEFVVGYWGSDTQIENVNIDSLQRIEGKINISGCSINNLLLRGNNSNTELSLNNLSVNTVSLFHVSTEVPMIFRNIKSQEVPGRKSEFSIYSCNLGKSEFFEIDFDHFLEFTIRHSMISNCIFLGCELNNPIRANISELHGDGIIKKIKGQIGMLSTNKKNFEAGLIGEGYDSELNDRNLNDLIKTKLPNAEREEIQLQVKYRRENYKQFKLSFKNSYDKIGERKFHSLEMNEYEKMKISFADRLILKVSQIFSNFGGSLWRPIVFNLFLVHTILFWLYLVFVSTATFRFTIAHYAMWDITLHAFQKYFYLFSPFRPLNKEDGLLDILFRSNAGFFIYNFLRATRKFNE